MYKDKPQNAVLLYIQILISSARPKTKFISHAITSNAKYDHVTTTIDIFIFYLPSTYIKYVYSTTRNTHVSSNNARSSRESKKKRKKRTVVILRRCSKARARGSWERVSRALRIRPCRLARVVICPHVSRSLDASRLAHYPRCRRRRRLTREQLPPPPTSPTASVSVRPSACRVALSPFRSTHRHLFLSLCLTPPRLRFCVRALLSRAQNFRARVLMYASTRHVGKLARSRSIGLSKVSE